MRWILIQMTIIERLVAAIHDQGEIPHW